MIDVAVIGLGAVGSAALYHLARQGARVVGIDAYDPPHALGSTHGRSRIIREAYFEHPTYVPLVRRAYENWEDLERLAEERLFTRTGGLMIGAPESGLVTGTLESAHQHDIAVSTLDADAIRTRFPALAPDPGMIGILEHNAGVLDPEACIRAHLSAAKALGAEVRINERVLGIESSDDAVRVTTTAGSVKAGRVVLAAGPWTRDLLETIGTALPLVVERQTMHWFSAASLPEFDASRLPVTLVEHQEGRYVYLIPDQGHGVKAAIHYEGAFVHPDSVQREVTRADVVAVTTLLARYTPALPSEPGHSAVCLYTNTPDKHFIVDELSGEPRLFVISACSGHGFKFASALGEHAAAIVLGRTPTLDMSHFAASRFA